MDSSSSDDVAAKPWWYLDATLSLDEELSIRKARVAELQALEVRALPVPQNAAGYPPLARSARSK